MWGKSRMERLARGRTRDEIPWRDGPGLSATDRMKLDLAIARFYANCQLAYAPDGELVRSKHRRHRPHTLDLMDEWALQAAMRSA